MTLFNLVFQVKNIQNARAEQRCTVNALPSAQVQNRF